jgi:hypothetical protein
VINAILLGVVELVKRSVVMECLLNGIGVKQWLLWLVQKILIKQCFDGLKASFIELN